MTEVQAAALADLRVRVVELVADVDPVVLDGPAAATPRWRVCDVLAHMVGVSEDIVHGRVDNIGSDEWTAAQVDKRRDATIDELLAEWAEFGPQFELLLAGAPELVAGQAVFDAATHEHDLRTAIGCPGARDSDAMEVSWDWLVGVSAASGAPAICFVTERGEEMVGAGAPEFVVHAPRFEIFRATTGRRTATEIASYRWEPAPDPPRLVGKQLFTMRTESLGE
jgi:hypothetical protein